MSELCREAFRYTALFCEENVWWAARELVDSHFDASQLQVLLFTNPNESVLMLNQRAEAGGTPIVWDYHVVLQVGRDATASVLDFDSRLDFPVLLGAYLQNSFPDQATLPERYQAWVRVIPAGDYLRHFFSDRSHMHGQLPESAFPDYPIIQPPAGVEAISLADYRDTHARLPDCSRVVPLSALFAGAEGYGGSKGM